MEKAQESRLLCAKVPATCRPVLGLNWTDTGTEETGVAVRVGTKILTISCTWDRVDNRLVMPFLHIFADDVCFIICDGDIYL